MILALVALAWLAIAPPFSVLVGKSIRLADKASTAARPLPGRLDPRAELPRLDRSLLVLGVLAAVVLALATRGQVVTWDGVTAVPVR